MDKHMPKRLLVFVSGTKCDVLRDVLGNRYATWIYLQHFLEVVEDDQIRRQQDVELFMGNNFNVLDYLFTYLFEMKIMVQYDLLCCPLFVYLIVN